MSGKENSLPKISIGIVVYNGVRHIRRALESVAEQPYPNIELIVVDGGSTDGTLDVLKEYADHISVRISEPDTGIYDAMNKVCTLATGDWLIFLGCDDILLGILESVATKLRRRDTVYYGDVVFRYSGKIYGGPFSKYRLMRQNICHQAMFYPRAVYSRHRYSLAYRWLADHAYNIQLMGEGIPFVYFGLVISIFNEKGSASLGDPEFGRNRLRLIRAAFGNAYVAIEMLRMMKEGLRARLAKAIRMYWQK